MANSIRGGFLRDDAGALVVSGGAGGGGGPTIYSRYTAGSDSFLNAVPHVSAVSPDKITVVLTGTQVIEVYAQLAAWSAGNNVTGLFINGVQALNEANVAVNIAASTQGAESNGLTTLMPAAGTPAPINFYRVSAAGDKTTMGAGLKFLLPAGSYDIELKYAANPAATAANISKRRLTVVVYSAVTAA